jgi:microcystin-dependent protein
MAWEDGGDILISDWLGFIQIYVGSTAPTGWLLCDGSAVSRATYAALFGLIGTTYGAGDGSTTFNVPDLRSSLPVGTGQRVRIMTFDGASAVDPSTDQITVTSNDWLHTGQAVALTGSSLPTGLSAGTYYVIPPTLRMPMRARL